MALTSPSSWITRKITELRPGNKKGAPGGVQGPLLWGRGPVQYKRHLALHHVSFFTVLSHQDSEYYCKCRLHYIIQDFKREACYFVTEKMRRLIELIYCLLKALFYKYFFILNWKCKVNFFPVFVYINALEVHIPCWFWLLTSIIPGSLGTLQYSFSYGTPEQSIPPLAGAGSSHSLRLSLVEYPLHPREHALQLVQGPHSPSIGEVQVSSVG